MCWVFVDGVVVGVCVVIGVVCCAFTLIAHSRHYHSTHSMEEDLRAQEEFLLRQEKPSVEVIKEKALPQKPPLSLVSPVGEIKERSPSSVREMKDTVRSESGFPEAQSVFRRSRGTQARWA